MAGRRRRILAIEKDDPETAEQLVDSLATCSASMRGRLDPPYGAALFGVLVADPQRCFAVVQ